MNKKRFAPISGCVSPNTTLNDSAQLLVVPHTGAVALDQAGNVSHYLNGYFGTSRAEVFSKTAGNGPSRGLGNGGLHRRSALLSRVRL